MSMKITRFDAENVKRIRAVRLEPSESGLMIIGGDNNQGKTSVLDSIAWTLGGENFRPSEPARKGSTIPPNLHIVMNNGLVVERKGKNSALKVTDPDGKKGGQQLLNEFTEQLALNLPKFMESTGKEKANTLLQIIGVGDQVAELERIEKEKYNERVTVGRIADQKEKYAAEQEFYPDVPDEPVSASDLISQQQDILQRNAQKKAWKDEYNDILLQIEQVEADIERHNRELKEAIESKKELEKKAKEAEKSPKELEMESTEELEKNLADIDEINWKVRANLDKVKAEDDAKQYREQYNRLTAEIEATRAKKLDLLNGAELPLPGLSVEDGELTYNGQKWDNMSGSEQLKVSTAIVRKLNPECGFILLDKLEQMDMKTLKEFGDWLEKEDLQAIATRVSTGDECSIYIEDGYSYTMDGNPTFAEEEKPKEEPKKWTKGAF